MKNNKNDIFGYWINSKNELFKFYYDYKILTINKNYNEKNLREIMALIEYAINSKKEEKKDNNVNVELKLKPNEFNKYDNESNNELIDYTIKFNNLDINENNYTKLIIFTFDKNNEKKYILQDIIDLSEIKRKKIDYYKIRMNEKIFLVPVKKVPICLINLNINKKEDNVDDEDNEDNEEKEVKEDTEDNKYKENKADNEKMEDKDVKEDKKNMENKKDGEDNEVKDDKEEKKNNKKKLYKKFETPKYCWNIGFLYPSFLCLSEEDNKVYSLEKYVSFFEYKTINFL